MYIFISYQAVCPAGCFNGGNCSEPGICTCPSMWTGNDCSQGMKYKIIRELAVIKTKMGKVTTSTL